MKFLTKNNFIFYLKLFWASDAGKVLVAVILWQFMMVLIGIIFDSSLNNIFQNPRVAPPDHVSPLSHTAGWDSGWYVSILNGSYLNDASASTVFYPAFPFAVIAIQTLSFGFLGDWSAGFIVNLIATFFAVLALLKISDYFVDRKFRWWVPILFIASPAAIFLHLFYAEALFCAFAFWAYFFALRRQWWQMGLVLGALTATRLPAILFIGLCGLEFLRAYGWSIKKILNKNLLWFLLAPLGFIIYGIYLYIVRGDFLAMVHGYKLTHDWAYHIFNPDVFQTYKFGLSRLYHVFTTTIPFDEGQSVNFLIPIAGLVILFLSSIYAIFRFKNKIGVPLGVFGIISIIFFTLNSNFVSVHRYLLPCLVIYLAIAHLASRRTWLHCIFYSVVYISILLQAYLFILFVNGYFAG